MKCPYCGSKKVLPPKVKKWETPSFAHGLCLNCDKHPRATVKWGEDGTMYISYSKDGRKPMPEYERKSILIAFRLSQRDVDNIKAGRANFVLDKQQDGVYTVLVTGTV